MVVGVQEWANSQAHFLGRLHSYEPSSCPSRRPKCHPKPGPWYHECRGRPHRSGQNKGHKCQSRLARRDSQVHLHLYHFNQGQPTTHTLAVLLFCEEDVEGCGRRSAVFWFSPSGCNFHWGCVGCVPLTAAASRKKWLHLLALTRRRLDGTPRSAPLSGRWIACRHLPLWHF
jgi:hypothetical protein